MDMVATIAGVLLRLCGAGVCIYLFAPRTPPQWYYGTQPQRPVPNTRRSEIERDFMRVFSMTSARGRENLIRRWIDRTGCDRTEAMRLATEEWRRDNR